MRNLVLFLAVLSLVPAAMAEKPSKNGQAVLKKLSGQRMYMGNVFLKENKEGDQFRMPFCRGSRNRLVKAVRLHAPKKKPNGAKNLDSAIKKVVLHFGNGSSRAYKFGGYKGKKLIVTQLSGDAFVVARFQQPRCVVGVKVVGEQWEAGSNRSNSFVRVIGKIAVPR